MPLELCRSPAGPTLKFSANICKSILSNICLNAVKTLTFLYFMMAIRAITSFDRMGKSQPYNSVCSSSTLQPLDVSCYGPFEVAWNAACHKYLRESGENTITRYDVCKMACKVYTAAVSVANIQSAFKRCGIYPFNPSVIRDTVIAPSLSFQSSEPVEVQQCPSSSSTVPTPKVNIPKMIK